MDRSTRRRLDMHCIYAYNHCGKQCISEVKLNYNLNSFNPFFQRCIKTKNQGFQVIYFIISFATTPLLILDVLQKNTLVRHIRWFDTYCMGRPYVQQFGMIIYYFLFYQILHLIAEEIGHRSLCKWNVSMAVAIRWRGQCVMQISGPTRQRICLCYWGTSSKRHTRRSLLDINHLLVCARVSSKK